MPHQVAITVKADVRRGQTDALRRLLDGMEAADPESAGSRENLLPFELLPVHFARFVVIEEADDLDGNPLPGQLIFMSDVDAPLRRYLTQLCGLAAEGLDQVFGHCEGYPDVAVGGRPGGLPEGPPHHRRGGLRQHHRAVARADPPGGRAAGGDRGLPRRARPRVARPHRGRRQSPGQGLRGQPAAPAVGAAAGEAAVAGLPADGGPSLRRHLGRPPGPPARDSRGRADLAGGGAAAGAEGGGQRQGPRSATTSTGCWPPRTSSSRTRSAPSASPSPARCGASPCARPCSSSTSACATSSTGASSPASARSTSPAGCSSTTGGD